jgi:hypothetical protein
MKKWKIKGSKELRQLYYSTSTIEKWSIGSYVVFCKDFTSVCPIGFVDKIMASLDHSNCVHLEKYLTLSINREKDGEVKWFATKQEAEDFVKTLTSRQTEKERLLEEALKRYPVGTKFKSVCDGDRVREIQPYHEGDSLIWKVNSDLTEIRSDNGIKTFDEFCSNPTIYENGKWAEIVEETVIPIEPSKSKYLIAAEKALKHFIDAGFYVGCEYESTKGTIYKSMCEPTIYSSDSKDCNIDCGGGFLWEYERGGQTDIYGKLIIEDKPQSMEREFQIGDRVECVNKYAHISVGMQGVIVEVSSVNIGVSWDTLTSGHSCSDKCDGGTGYYIMRDNVRLIGTSSFNTPTSQELNTYGLQVGDALNVDVLNAWTVIEGNRSTNYKTEWHKGGGMFIGNRIIKSFCLIHGHVGFEVSDTGIVYLKAEGFKEFADNYYGTKEFKWATPHYESLSPQQLQDRYAITMHKREMLLDRLTQEESNQTQKLLTLPTNKIYVRKSKSIK